VSSDGSAITSITPFATLDGGPGLVVTTARGAVYTYPPKGKGWIKLPTKQRPSTLIGIAPDNTQPKLVIVSGDNLYVYDPITGKLLAEISVPGGPFYSLTIVTVGGTTYIYLGGLKDYVQLTLPNDGKIVLPTAPNPRNPIAGADGPVYIAVPATGPRKGKVIEAYPDRDDGGKWTIVVKGGSVVLADATGLPPVSGMAVSADGMWLMVTFDDGSVRIWNLETGALASTIP